jgi:plasmid stabilization system protein ParE
VRVRWTRPALADLEEILDFISIHSPVGARRVQARLRTVVDILSRHPLIGSRTEDETIGRMTTSPYPYFVFYEVTEAELIIHAVRHAARDPSGMPGT